MISPIAVLNILNTYSKDKEYTFKRIYRNFYNPAFYQLAYAKLLASDKPIPLEIIRLIDISEGHLEKVIDSIKNGNYKSGKHLGDDLLVEEVSYLLLEAIYSDRFSDWSFGYMKNKSTHTCLKEVTSNFTGSKWLITLDAFSASHHVDGNFFISILRKQIHDEQFIRFIYQLYRDCPFSWQEGISYSGLPRNTDFMEIIVNILLNEFDAFMESYKESFTKIPKTRKTSKEYEKAQRRFKKAKKVMQENEEHTKEMIQEFKAAQVGKMKEPYRNPIEPDYKRLFYVRYGGKILLGVIGSKKDARAVADDFVKDLGVMYQANTKELRKTVVLQHSSEKIRFLGYDIQVNHRKDYKRLADGQLKNALYGKVGIYVPKDVWMRHAFAYGAVEVSVNPATGKEQWRPMPRTHLMNWQDDEIVMQFNRELFFLYTYYRIALNAFTLNHYYYMARYSLLKTLAGKYRTNVSDIKAKYMHGKVLGVPFSSKSGICTFYHDGFNRMEFGFDELRDIIPGEHKTPDKYFLKNRVSKCECDICHKETKDLFIYKDAKMHKKVEDPVIAKAIEKSGKQSQRIASEDR